MDLLISHYGYRSDSFSLESEIGVNCREEWYFWYGEQDQQPAIGELFDALLEERTDWTEGGPIYTGEQPMPKGSVALIRAVRVRHG